MLKSPRHALGMLYARYHFRKSADECHSFQTAFTDARRLLLIMPLDGSPLFPVAPVVAMLARGLQTKQVARTLGISPKTADRHIQNAYAKLGVSTRAAATLCAIEHGLLAWGELPMEPPTAAL